MRQIFDDDAVYIRLENLAGFRVAWARAWVDVCLHKPAANGFTAKHNICSHSTHTFEHKYWRETGEREARSKKGSRVSIHEWEDACFAVFFTFSSESDVGLHPDQIGFMYNAKMRI